MDKLPDSRMQIQESAPEVAGPADDSPHRIGRLSAEFIDRDTEAAYRSWFHPAMLRQAQVTIFVSICLILLYSIVDYLMLLSTRDWMATVGLRSAIFITGLLVLSSLKRLVTPTQFDVAITFFEFVTIALLLYIFTHYRGDVLESFLSLLLIIIALYLFIPNRFILAVGVAISTSLGFVWITHFIHGAALPMTTHISIILLTTNIIGVVYAQRYHTTQRQAFAELMRERSTREQLQVEIEQRKNLEEQLWQLAQTDGLTGLANRRHFMDEANSEIGRSKRYQHPVSLLMIDIDHFKNINDTHGHDAGDEVLKQLTELCRHRLRKNDLFGRLGGEEFAVLTQEESANSAKYTGERLRSAVEEHFASTPYAVTISIGITDLRPGDNGIGDMLKRADNALYEAKHQGRNRIVNVS